MNRMCKNGCNAECYPARLVCKRCVAAESLERKRATQGAPMKRGRPAEKLTGDKLAKAIEMYKASHTLNDVAAATGASRTAVARSLRKAGVTLRSNGWAAAASPKKTITPPLQGFNPLMGRMASVSLMVSV